jgi:hypothetical protein
MDFHSLSTSVQDFDARIRCDGGVTGSAGQGGLTYTALRHIFTGGNVGINISNPAQILDIVGRARVRNLNVGDPDAIIEFIPNGGGVNSIYVDSILQRFNLTAGLVVPDLMILNHNSPTTSGLLIQNSSTANNLTRGSYVKFTARDVFNLFKDIGGIISLPADVNYIDSITRITGRKNDVADFNTVEIRHANQSMIIGLNANAGSDASLFLVNDTTTGARGARFHYAGDGNTYFDLNSANAMGSLIFRIDNSFGSTQRASINISGDVTATRYIIAQNVPGLGINDAFVSGTGILSTAFSDIRMKKEIERGYDIDEVWDTIQPIKYLYKTDIANQVSIHGGYRKTYGFNASNLHDSLKTVKQDVKVEMCKFCQNSLCNIDNCEKDCCKCENIERIDACNYNQREILSLSVSKINQLKNMIEDMKIEMIQLRDVVNRLSSIFTMGSNIASITPRFADNDLQKAKEILVNQVVKPSTPSKYITM